MLHRHSFTWLIIFCVIALMFLRLPQMAARQDVILSKYAALVEVDALAKQKYVQPIRDERLVDGAIRGMLRQLDPYSAYIPSDQLLAFERRNRGDFIGVGVEIGVRRGRLTVVAPVEGGPAIEAGVHPGDVILSVEGRNVDGLSVLDVEGLLNGSSGKPISLTVERQGEPGSVAITIEPGPVSFHTVRGFARDDRGGQRYLIDEADRIGYIRVSSFLENTTRDFDEALSDLKRAGVRGLVLDLRFNPGGVMTVAVEMVDRFINAGLIVSTVSRRLAIQEYQATRGGAMEEVKLAVLVNGASASASEIVAGAIQDRGRAVVVGERTFGKGSVQRLIYLKESGGAVKLTTAHYRLPNGRIIHRTAESEQTDSWGVTPDVVVPLSLEELHKIRMSRQNLDARPSGKRDILVKYDPDKDNTRRELYRDPQLLKALTIVRQQIRNDHDLERIR